MFIAFSVIWAEGGKKGGREEGRKEGRREKRREERREEGQKGGREGVRKGKEGGREKEEREVPLPVSLREEKAQVVSLGWEENEGIVDAQTKAHQNL